MEYDELLANMKSHLWNKIERKMAQASTQKLREFLGLQGHIRPEERPAYAEGKTCVLQTRSTVPLQRLWLWDTTTQLMPL